MRVGKIHIPLGIISVVLGVIFFIFGGGDPFYVWWSGFSIGSGVIQTIAMLRLWSLE